MPEKKGQQNPEMVDRDALCPRNVLINTYTKWLPKELCPINVHLENNDQSGYPKWLPKELGPRNVHLENNDQSGYPK